MPIKKNLADVISQLKNVREEKGISYQDIVDATEEQGVPVSLSTVRRVFTSPDGTEFRYDTTIRPIVRVVLGLDDSTERYDPENARSYFSDMEALKSVVELKNALVESSRQQLQEVKEEADKKISYLKQEAQSLRDTSAKDREYWRNKLQEVENQHEEERKGYRRAIRVLASIILFLSLAILSILLIDLLVPHAGWFRATVGQI